mgnify:CR=1 FL=1
MTDHLTKEKRSWNMSRIRSKNTKPEMIVRSFLFSKGFRYRLHNRKLPGKPDIVLKKHRTAIQVRGCFWHQHGCKFSNSPKSNKSYWLPKLEKNKERDKLNDKKIKKLGWKLIVIWECKLPNNLSKLISI